MIEWWTRAYVGSNTAVAHAYDVQLFRISTRSAICGHRQFARYALSHERPTQQGDEHCKVCVVILVSRAFDEPLDFLTEWRKKPMRHIVYECDWCGDKAPAGVEETYPDGWSEFADDKYALLCEGCHCEAKDAVKEAVARAIMSTKQRRRDARDAARARETPPADTFLGRSS